MTDKLARVRWEMGQTLLPENFLAQEESLIADTILRFRMSGLPAYGVSSLKWNDDLLNEGIFSIQTMTLVMPSGFLLDVPGNAQVSPFNLNVPGTVTVPVYCHLTDHTAAADAEETWESPQEGTIPKILYRLLLSSEQSHEKGLEAIKLVEFEKNPDGIWQLSKNFIPPLLQVSTSPFLKAELKALVETMELFQYNLSMDAASYLSGSSLIGVQQCLGSVYRTQRFVGNLFSQIHMHPYYLYEELKGFYNNVCFYKSATPENITSPYNHDQLAGCFADIFRPLSKQMQLTQVRSPYLPFEFNDGIYRITLSAEIREAREVYFLIQKSHINQKVVLENLKLAPFSRISMVHKLALPGIPLKKVDQPAFQHSFGHEVEFFRIMEGEEWDNALRELSVAFYDHPQLKNMEFYLYRR
jgi:type VI secretion system protein ImpJ